VSEETLKNKAKQVAQGLADKPVLLLEVYQLLEESDPRPKVAGPWVMGERDDLFYRYDLLSNGRHVSLVQNCGAYLKWAVKIQKGEINGSAPDEVSAIEVVEHFLRKDGWVFVSGDLPREDPDVDDGDDEDSSPKKREDYYPKDEDDGDDIPF